MEQFGQLIDQWNSTPKDLRNSFYKENILPIVSKLLSQQYQHYLSLHKYKPYTTLITTLSHDINVLLLMLYTIKPKQCVVFYTTDKNKLVQKLHAFAQSLNVAITLIELDSIDHAGNSALIKETMKRYKKNHPPVLCDITGGKKILSTQIGILAHSLKMDIAYIDSKKGFLQWGIPEPGSEILYIQKPDNIFNLLEIHPTNKLRVRFNSMANAIDYEADVDGRLYRLGSKKIKQDDSDRLADYINSFYSSINASILHNSYSTTELKHYALALKALLFSKELNHFIEKHNNLTHLVIDTELSALPWEIILAYCNVDTPLLRIPNRDSNFSENISRNTPKSIAIISGSGDGLPDFDTILQKIKLQISRYNNFLIETLNARGSFELKRFFAEHNAKPFTVVVFYGHNIFDACNDKSGLVCQDGSIFSIEDCEVLSGGPPECIVVNACQSARSSLFTPNSFAHAALSTGVETYIGTHFFLEFERSTCFLHTFLEAIAHNLSYSYAYKQSLESLAKRFGSHDISLYNYVYYGY